MPVHLNADGGGSVLFFFYGGEGRLCLGGYVDREGAAKYFLRYIPAQPIKPV